MHNRNLDILSYDIEELSALLVDMGYPAFRGRQLFQWLHAKGVWDYAALPNLPRALRERLAAAWPLDAPRLLQRRESARGDTVKLLLELADGEQVETVLMLYGRARSRDRATCCVSTQTGCAMGCAFCATGRFQTARNLTAGEICAQVVLTAAVARERGFAGVTNVVYMGMGEPLLNLAHVHKSILLLNHPQGQNIGQRRMVVSTCGLVPQIHELAALGLQVGLAVSLHSADPATRARLMPAASRYSLAELLDACRAFRQRTGRRVTFEYALFAGVNDSPEAARQLARYLAGSDILINLIPANPWDSAGFLPPRREIIEDFCALLREAGCEAALREARGQDIDAACGQLKQQQTPPARR